MGDMFREEKQMSKGNSIVEGLKFKLKILWKILFSPVHRSGPLQ